MKENNTLVLQLRRQVYFTLSMLKVGLLGIDLGKESCDVLDVAPSSMIDRWNQISVPQFEVVEGDQVVRVGQATTDLSGRLEKLNDGERCSITFMRPIVIDGG